MTTADERPTGNKIIDYIYMATGDRPSPKYNKPLELTEASIRTELDHILKTCLLPVKIDEPVVNICPWLDSNEDEFYINGNSYHWVKHESAVVGLDISNGICAMEGDTTLKRRWYNSSCFYYTVSIEMVHKDRPGAYERSGYETPRCLVVCPEVTLKELSEILYWVSGKIPTDLYNKSLLSEEVVAIRDSSATSNVPRSKVYVFSNARDLVNSLCFEKEDMLPVLSCMSYPVGKVHKGYRILTHKALMQIMDNLISQKERDDVSESARESKRKQAHKQSNRRQNDTAYSDEIPF